MLFRHESPKSERNSPTAALVLKPVIGPSAQQARSALEKLWGVMVAGWSRGAIGTAGLAAGDLGAQVRKIDENIGLSAQVISSHRLPGFPARYHGHPCTGPSQSYRG